jgi:hypothetical protein
VPGSAGQRCGCGTIGRGLSGSTRAIKLIRAHPCQPSADQRQLDVSGELLDAAQRLAEQPGELDPVAQQFLAAAADAAASRWNEKDQGNWESRGEPRDFPYSELMCRVALTIAVDGGMSLHPKFA